MQDCSGPIQGDTLYVPTWVHPRHDPEPPSRWIGHGWGVSAHMTVLTATRCNACMHALATPVANIYKRPHPFADAGRGPCISSLHCSVHATSASGAAAAATVDVQGCRWCRRVLPAPRAAQLRPFTPRHSSVGRPASSQAPRPKKGTAQYFRGAPALSIIQACQKPYSPASTTNA